ncbi:hypothetical protein [Bifidobacterium aquikefiri]|uniref:hypothetical protein n=1 Tax=Bifidobacterium aquikefiri TaxID=1653207 RepID=UPI0039E82960
MNPETLRGFTCMILGHKPKSRILHERHGIIVTSRYPIIQCARCGQILDNTGRRTQ